jgi:hypothetical protein
LDGEASLDVVDALGSLNGIHDCVAEKKDCVYRITFDTTGIYYTRIL